MDRRRPPARLSEFPTRRHSPIRASRAVKSTVALWARLMAVQERIIPLLRGYNNGHRERQAYRLRLRMALRLPLRARMTTQQRLLPQGMWIAGLVGKPLPARLLQWTVKLVPLEALAHTRLRHLAREHWQVERRPLRRARAITQRRSQPRPMLPHLERLRRLL